MKIEISIGELVDKVSILSIKLQKVKNTEKLANIKKEYDTLLQAMIEAGIEKASDEYQKLEKINLTLWNIEDRIRLKEAAKEFDDEFIQLARNVYFTNDERAAIKKEINIKCNSGLIEEKEYTDYK